MLSGDEKNTVDLYNNIAGYWSKARNDKNFWANEHEKFKIFLPAGKILDIGCGAGRDSFWFVDNGYEYLGVDGSESMVKLARENNQKAKFEVKNFYEISSLKNAFNGFWAAASLLHIPKSQISEILKTIKNLLEPDGVGFISLKEGKGEKNEIWQDTHFSRFFAYYIQQEFADILRLSRFSVLESGKKLSPRDSSTVWLTYFVKSE